MKPKLPIGIDPDASINIGNLYTSPRTVADWRAKAEDHQRLVIALRSLVEALPETRIDWGRLEGRGLAFGGFAKVANARELLRELGEIK